MTGLLLTSNEYAHWISRTKDAHTARCMLCYKDIDISSMRESPRKLMSESLESSRKVLEFYFQKQVGTLCLINYSIENVDLPSRCV